MTDPTLLRIRIAAPVDAVWHALTDADALRAWFAEHADVALPDTYEFWGRYTPDGDKPRQRLLHAADHTLRFAWVLDGTDTTVDITLTPDGPSTAVTVTQTNLPGFADMVAGENVLSGVYTFWSLSLVNLADHLAGRPLTARCDYTTTDFRAEILIDATPHAVYESIADPAIFGRWFGVNAESERRVGGHWSMGPITDDSPTILRLDDDSAMAIQWPGDMVETWEMAGSGGGTKLTYVQSGFADPHPHGAWAGAVAGLAELRRYHEIPNWQPMWLKTHVAGTPDGMLSIGG